MIKAPKAHFHGGLVTKSCLTPVTPWTAAHQAPLSMGFSRQEHWSGLPFPPPGDLPNPGNEPESLTSPALAGELFTPKASSESPYYDYSSMMEERFYSCV